jgi:hypothetical protein
MASDGMRVLRWVPEDNRWIEDAWDAFISFRAFMTPFAPLPNVAGGIHHFVVCVCDESQVFNIIPHKYLVEPGGKIGADNFYGWTREERDDYSRLMVASKEEAGDRERLNEIRDKAGNAMYPPREALYPLVRALPFVPIKGSAAYDFLDALAAGTPRSKKKPTEAIPADSHY